MYILTNHLGIVSYIAYCHDCEWAYEDHMDRGKLRNMARAHVKKTGHTITIAKESVTKYSREG